MLERSEVVFNNLDESLLKSEKAESELSNITPFSPKIENVHQTEKLNNSKLPTEAYLSVINSGMQTGENMFLFNGPDNKPHMGNILYSEMYNLKSTGTGEIIGYFLQYEEGYRGGDGFGIFHPGSVPNRKIVKNHEGRIYQDNSERKVGYRGNETVRVLTVRYNPNTQEVEREYIKGKDLRYALDDKRRLDEARNSLRKMKEPIENVLSLSTEVSVVAD